MSESKIILPWNFEEEEVWTQLDAEGFPCYLKSNHGRVVKEGCVSESEDDRFSEMEIWRPVLGWTGYYVSNFGNVSQKTKTGQVGRNPLKLVRNRNPGSMYYPFADLREGKRRWIAFIHQLVAEFFLGPRLSGMEIHHIDKDIENARADNLVYLTQAEHQALHKGEIRGLLW